MWSLRSPFASYLGYTIKGDFLPPYLRVEEGTWCLSAFYSVHTGGLPSTVCGSLAIPSPRGNSAWHGSCHLCFQGTWTGPVILFLLLSVVELPDSNSPAGVSHSDLPERSFLIKIASHCGAQQGWWRPSSVSDVRSYSALWNGHQTLSLKATHFPQSCLPSLCCLPVPAIWAPELAITDLWVTVHQEPASLWFPQISQPWSDGGKSSSITRFLGFYRTQTCPPCAPWPLKCSEALFSLPRRLSCWCYPLLVRVFYTVPFWFLSACWTVGFPLSRNSDLRACFCPSLLSSRSLTFS